MTVWKFPEFMKQSRGLGNRPGQLNGKYPDVLTASKQRIIKKKTLMEMLWYIVTQIKNDLLGQG